MLVCFFSRIPQETTAAVTLGKGLTKDKLVQACMRMRLLGNGHYVQFYASSEVNIQILAQKLSCQTPDRDINCLDVLEWSIENSLYQIKNDFMYWSVQGLTFFKKQCAAKNFELNGGDMNIYFQNCQENYSNMLTSIYGNDRKETLVKEIVKEKVKRIKRTFDNSTKQDCIDDFEKESNRILEKLEIIKDVKKTVQFQEEEIEVEIEIEQEEECEIERPEKATPCENKLDENVQNFIKTGILIDNKESFLQLSESFKWSSLYTNFEREIRSWSSNLFITRDFASTVKPVNFDDYYLARPRWIAFSKLKNILVFLSSFEANEYLNEFYSTKCAFIMNIPIIRQKQKRRFISFKMDENEIDEDILQEVSLFCGSLYFKNKKEQDSYLKLISFVPCPRSPLQDNHFQRNKIERNGFVLPENRYDVFGENKKKGKLSFDTDPSKFITELVSIRNYQIVPNSSHHLVLFLDGKKPFIN
jgi:hypothetical protein